MGRFSVETSLKNPQQPSMQPGMMGSPSDWPTFFPKETIGINRNGIIVEDKPILTLDDMSIIPGSLEGIRALRLKGYKVFLFFNEPLISLGKLTPQDVDMQNQKLMNIFGQAGIFSIDGLLYSTSDNKQDMYALPNNGMLKKAENDSKLKFKGGYFIGTKISDLKVADSVGAKPILIESPAIEDTKTKLDTFANKELKSKTHTFINLLEFANSLN